MKIFRSDQIKEIDDYTIMHEPVKSIDLMERAAAKLFRWYVNRFDRVRKVFVFAGPGNNGGDGLALARMLVHDRYNVEIHYVKITEKRSADWEINYNRLNQYPEVVVNILDHADKFPVISSGDVIIDAVFGSGLTRPVAGFSAEIIKMINDTDSLRISIDIPSGLFCEDNSSNNYDSVVRADYTLSFQFPKLAFMFAENNDFTGVWEVLPIGLSEAAIRKTGSPFTFNGKDDIAPLIRHRRKFDHKGMYGHGLVAAGSKGKMGAAVLSAKAALRSGIGLITCHIPSAGINVLQTALPEAMVISDQGEDFITEVDNPEVFDAAGIGPGIGTGELTSRAVHSFIKEFAKPLVIDADALNILGENRDWYSLLHPGVILTPHPKEFERLSGKCENGYERLQQQIDFSVKNKCIVVLKGAFTSITTPDGNVMFNSTGNPGMATAGSGDVLTGIILSLLAQGYFPENAAVAGVYIHGLAGDIAAGNTGLESLTASDIINNIGNAYNTIKGQ